MLQFVTPLKMRMFISHDNKAILNLIDLRDIGSESEMLILKAQAVSLSAFLLLEPVDMNMLTRDTPYQQRGSEREMREIKLYQSPRQHRYSL